MGDAALLLEAIALLRESSKPLFGAAPLEVRGKVAAFLLRDDVLAASVLEQAPPERAHASVRVQEFCREWPAGGNRCDAPAEVILWGKLFPPEALGPRCYDHAAKHIGHAWVHDSAAAAFDLRNLYRADPASASRSDAPAGVVSVPDGSAGEAPEEAPGAPDDPMARLRAWARDGEHTIQSVRHWEPQYANPSELRADVRDVLAAVARLQRERDEARQALDGRSEPYQDAYNAACERAGEAERERDDAHAALRKIAAANGYTERASWLIGVARGALRAPGTGASSPCVGGDEEAEQSARKSAGAGGGTP